MNQITVHFVVRHNNPCPPYLLTMTTICQNDGQNDSRLNFWSQFPRTRKIPKRTRNIVLFSSNRSAGYVKRSIHFDVY